MALTSCSNCKKNISTHAKTCPHCGTLANNYTTCPECSKRVSHLESVCLHCGFPIDSVAQPIVDSCFEQRTNAASNSTGIIALLEGLEPLSRERSPNWACLIGLVSGGLGLGVYFGTLIDLCLPVMIAIGLSVALGEIGFVGGVLIAGIYGYYRAKTSNDNLAR